MMRAATFVVFWFETGQTRDVFAESVTARYATCAAWIGDPPNTSVKLIVASLCAATDHAISHAALILGLIAFFRPVIHCLRHGDALVVL